ncbi:MAG: Plug domain-containing protein [Elusimicrobia bacterium]|nr:Plug domain-containing protein [Elusimicrobiota bacterium]
MLDGVNINDPMTLARTSNISIINPIYLARVEVLNNPQSGLYGADTIGGIILFELNFQEIPY